MIWRTLSGRLAVTALLVAFIASIVQILVIAILGGESANLAEQWLSWEVANEASRQLATALRDGASEANLKHQLELFSRLNPHVDFYVLDSEGRILLGRTAAKGSPLPTVVDVHPIQKFVATSVYPDSTIYGDNPAAIEGANRRVPISAAELRWGERTTYVYAVLKSTRFQELVGAIEGVSFRSGILLLFGSALSVSTVVAWIVFHRLMKRFARITVVLTSFRDGNFAARIMDKTDDDIGEHGRAFDKMADVIVDNMDRLSREDKLRRELVSNISHDLRTPIAVMQTSLESQLVNQEHLTEERRQELLHRAVRGCRSLSRLVDDLFSFSILDALESVTDPEDIQLGDLVNDIVANFEVRACDADVKLCYESVELLPFVKGDLAMMERLVTNLVDNALRYTPAGGMVTISVTHTAGKVVLSVADTGIGIAAEELQLIFGRFYRAANARSISFSKGTGLGLATCRRIAELHRGTIDVQSEVGKGSNFRVQFPVG